MYIRKIGAVVAASTLTVGCSNDSGRPASAEVEVRDSAGITIVENRLLESVPVARWEIAAEPVFEVGALDGDPEYVLHDVLSAVRFSDGGVVVANSGTRELRLFDSLGRHERSVGARGSGPGEFDGLIELTKLPGDSIAAFDSGTRRVTIFDRSGDIVGSVSPHTADVGAAPRLVGYFDDGLFLFVADAVFDRSNVSDGLFRPDTRYVVVDREGEWVADLGKLPGPEYYVVTGEWGYNADRLPFGKEPIAATNKRHFIFGSGDRDEVMLRSADGRVETIVRFDRPRKALSREAIRTNREMEMAGATHHPIFREVLATRLDRAPYPSHLAYYDQIAVAGDRLWIRSPTGPDKPQAWLAVGSDGAFQGTLHVPAGLNVQQVDNEHVLAIGWDEADVQHVRVFQMVERAR